MVIFSLKSSTTLRPLSNTLTVMALRATPKMKVLAGRVAPRKLPLRPRNRTQFIKRLNEFSDHYEIGEIHDLERVLSCG